jgi:hypothetical protein
MSSWTAYVPTPTEPSAFKDALEDIAPSRELTMEEAAQFEAAKEAVAQLVERGVIGGRPLVASFTGVATPGHLPDGRSGVRSTIAISVIQAASPEGSA